MNDKTIVVATRMNREVFLGFGNFHNFWAFHRYLKLFLVPCFMFLLAFLNHKQGRIEFSIVVVLLGILFPAISILRSKHSLKLQCDRLKLTDTQNQVVYNLTLSDENVSIQNKAEHLSIPWDKILRVYILKQYCFLYLLRNKAFILPYKNIQTGTKEELLQLFESKLKKSVLLDYRNNQWIR